MSYSRLVLTSIATCLLSSVSLLQAQWPEPVARVVPQADGYVAIPHAAKAPHKARTYRALFDATQAADAPDHLLPALNMAGSELNALDAAGVPLRRAKFVVVFHGAALDGILDDTHYRSKFGKPNPNLAVLAEMRKAGVELFVCGQNLAFAKIDPANTVAGRDDRQRCAARFDAVPERRLCVAELLGSAVSLGRHFATCACGRAGLVSPV